MKPQGPGGRPLHPPILTASASSLPRSGARRSRSAGQALLIGVGAQGAAHRMDAAREHGPVACMPSDERLTGAHVWGKRGVIWQGAISSGSAGTGNADDGKAPRRSSHLAGCGSRPASYIPSPTDREHLSWTSRSLLFCTAWWLVICATVEPQRSGLPLTSFLQQSLFATV